MTDDNGGKPKDGRDAKGRFAPGNPGGPGRPRGVDFRHLVRQAKGDKLEDALVAVYDALVKRAKSGDVAAAKLLLDRLTSDEPTGAARLLVELATGVPHQDEDETDDD